MEKNLLKKLIASLMLIFSAVCLWAQTPSVIEHIRIPLWAELDAYPGSEQAQDSEAGLYDYPISRIKEVAPFLVSGMVYGWSFTYTPSDKSRNVEEYFELTEIQPLNPPYEVITYVSPWVQDNRLNCWCEYTRTEPQIQNYYLWSSIQNPVIHGRGYGKLDKGFDGIRDAAEDAVKEAVRDYYRSVIKNKPKEITGSVLVRNIPTIGIKAGQYIINLDFFLECGRILEYKLY